MLSVCQREHAVTILVAAAVIIQLCLLSGCAPVREPSRTPRTSIEQLLLSSAIERSLTDVALPLPQHVPILLEATGLARLSSQVGRSGVQDTSILYGPSTDLSYLRDVVAARMGELGFRIRERPEDADYLVKIMVEALGTEQGETFVGLPALALFAFALPELTLYKEVERKGYVRFSAKIYEQRTGKFLRSTPIYSGDAYYTQYTMLILIRFYTSDLILPP